MADTDQVLNLAAIIRKVDGNHSKGAAALAESILDHPGFRAALADEPAEPIPPAALPEGYIDPEHSEDDRALLQTFYSACQAEGGTADEVTLRGLRAVLARWGRPAPAPPADVSQLSDGYHTFAELYEHRHSLMLALMRALPRICWFSRRHADGELPFGSDDWFIVGAELPGAPITYHLPAALYSLAQKTGALELPAGRPWDGHSAADVVHRLRDWAIEPTPPAAGEVAELVEWLREQLHVCLQAPWTPGIKHFGRAAELLERQVLVPVPVSERLPGPEDCDASGRCWWLHVGEDGVGDWLQRAPYPSVTSYALFRMTHWLPAHALPLPEVGD